MADIFRDESVYRRVPRGTEGSGALSEANVNVESLNIADTRDFGIVRLVTDDNDKAQAALTAAGFTTARGDLVGIEVPTERLDPNADPYGSLERLGVEIWGFSLRLPQQDLSPLAKCSFWYRNCRGYMLRFRLY